MTVRIIREGYTFGMTGSAKWDASVGKYEVAFRSPWVGFYTLDEIEFTDEGQV